MLEPRDNFAGNGLGQGAMKIVRTLMETVINAEYLRQYPNELDDYINWSWVEKEKGFKICSKGTCPIYQLPLRLAKKR